MISIMHCWVWILSGITSSWMLKYLNNIPSYCCPPSYRGSGTGRIRNFVPDPDMELKFGSGPDLAPWQKCFQRQKLFHRCKTFSINEQHICCNHSGSDRDRKLPEKRDQEQIVADPQHWYGSISLCLCGHWAPRAYVMGGWHLGEHLRYGDGIGEGWLHLLRGGSSQITHQSENHIPPPY